MSQARDMEHIYRVRMLPKDLGVALIVLVALAAGWLLLTQTDNRTRAFAANDSPFRMNYPAAWISTQSLQQMLLKAENPATASTFKTTLTVDSRELDTQNPPTLQTLRDRRIEQQTKLTGYHFLSDQEATVGGAKAIELQYAYVVQPIDMPRRATLPVVVHAREYIVATANETFYITLAAPENEFNEASAQFDRMLQTVQVQ